MNNPKYSTEIADDQAKRLLDDNERLTYTVTVMFHEGAYIAWLGDSEIELAPFSNRHETPREAVDEVFSKAVAHY